MTELTWRGFKEKGEARKETGLWRQEKQKRREMTETDGETERQAEDQRERQKVGKIHLLKGNIDDVHRSCS